MPNSIEVARVRASSVLKIRSEHPDFTLQKVSKMVGISREGVRQILLKSGVPTVAIRPHKHCICGKRIYVWKKYCSRACLYKNVPYLKIPCSFCGKEKVLLRAPFEWHQNNDSRYKGRVFCNNYCQGKWFGKNYGWGVNGHRVKYLTHCKRGHEFTEENTHIPPTRPTQRICRACWKIRYYLKKEKLLTL